MDKNSATSTGTSEKSKSCECCRSPLVPKWSLVCSTPSCRREYRHSCAGLTDDAYKKLPALSKSKWVCPACKCARPKGGDNNNTPIRPAHSNAAGSLDISHVNTLPRSKGETKGEIVVSTNCESPSSLPSWYKTLEESLSTRLRAMLKSELTEIKTSNDEILKNICFLNERYDEMQIQLTSNNDEIGKLKKENEKLKLTLSDLSSRISRVELHSRECNLELSCLPEFKNENLVSTVVQLASVVSCPIQISDTDIVTCKRVAKLNPSSERPRNVIVKLRTTDQRDGILAAVTSFNKKNHKEKLNSSHLGLGGTKSPIYVSEHLSPSTKQLHAAARKAVREKSYKHIWVRNGLIFVRKDDTAQAIKIRDINDILKIQ